MACIHSNQKEQEEQQLTLPFSSSVVLPDFKQPNETILDHAILCTQTYWTAKMSGRDAEDNSPVSRTDTKNKAGENDFGEKKDAVANDIVADPNLVDSVPTILQIHATSPRSARCSTLPWPAFQFCTRTSLTSRRSSITVYV